MWPERERRLDYLAEPAAPATRAQNYKCDCYIQYLTIFRSSSRSTACWHTLSYFPEEMDSTIPQKQTLNCFRCRAIFFFFFHRHQQTNQDGARCLSTAWGRTSSCEFPWPKSDSEWLRSAVKITGEVTKWHWERLETVRRQKHETEKLRAKALYGVLKVILWYSVEQCGKTENKQERQNHESDMRPCCHKYFVVAVGSTYNTQVWSCLFKLGRINVFKSGENKDIENTMKLW